MLSILPVLISLRSMYNPAACPRRRSALTAALKDFSTSDFSRSLANSCTCFCSLTSCVFSSSALRFRTASTTFGNLFPFSSSDAVTFARSSLYPACLAHSVGVNRPSFSAYILTNTRCLSVSPSLLIGCCMAPPVRLVFATMVAPLVAPLSLSSTIEFPAL